MGRHEEILNFQNALTSAELLLRLHGASAWLVADKRSLDCYLSGLDEEGGTWDRVKLIINEMNTKAGLPKNKIH